MKKWIAVAAIAMLTLFLSCRRTPTEPNLQHEKANGACWQGSCR